MKKILTLFYILCFSALTSCFAQNKSLENLYEQLDFAIKQSQHYINLKESRIAKIKTQSKQGHTPPPTTPKLLLQTIRGIQSIPKRLFYLLYSPSHRLGKKKQHEERLYQVEKFTCFTIFNIRSFHGGTSCSTKYR